jgi:two-component system, sensor histidine kinase and response regulator
VTETGRSASRILIVDDERLSRETAEALLAGEEYALSFAASGREALDQLRDLPVDVILLDVMMPGIDGHEVSREIKRDPNLAHIPIILVTALDSGEDVARGLAAGADEFVTKPVHGDELRARVRSMLRIKHQFDDLAETMRLRDELAHMIVHDMAAPLSAIIALSEMLLDPIAGLPANAQQRLRTIRDAAHRLHGFSSEILVISKLEHGRLLLNREPVDLGQLAQQGKQLIAPVALAKGIVIETVVRDVATTEKTLDLGLFTRVIENLLTNAVKHSPMRSTVTLSLSYVDGPPNLGLLLRIRVCDLGRGIPEKDRERIFDKYGVIQLQESGAQVGLGLYFCRMVAEAHGGRIYTEANHPTGSVFTIDI